MVELVDAHASGACGGNSVEVRVFFRAPNLLIVRIKIEREDSEQKVEKIIQELASTTIK